MIFCDTATGDNLKTVSPADVMAMNDDLCDRLNTSHVEIFTDVGNWVILDRLQFVIKMMCIVFGIPLNLFVSLLIIFSGNQEHTLNLGVIFSNMYTLSMAVLEYVLHYWPNRVFCFVYYSTFGSSYTLLLVNVLLATLDRWTTLALPRWRCTSITMFHLVLLQIAAFFLISILLAMPYIVRVVPLQCDVNLTVLKWIAMVDCPLIILCAAVKIQFYRTSRKWASREQVVFPAIAIAVATLLNRSFDHTERRVQDMLVAQKRCRFPIKKLQRDGRISLMSGLISLLIFAIPNAIIFIYVLLCETWMSSCTSLESVLAYVSLFWYVHAIHNGILVLIRNPHLISDSVRTLSALGEVNV